jgi:malate dehydrogenase (oxaloacetate-decarboxylating)
MEPYRVVSGENGSRRLEVPLRGASLLRRPMYNKGTAFTEAERTLFGLQGLLPNATSHLSQQAERFVQNLERKSDELEKYIGLASLQDRNETLFYRVLVDHLEQLMPIVYTPTVGRACQDFSHIFRRARGLWITPEHQGHIYEVLENAPFEDVRLIVVTDNERILGLGDQGAGGMGIPVGKLALYVAAAGIHPTQTLPVSLDVGTDNPRLFEDELYLGWRHKRLRGDRYDALVAEFVRAVIRRFPKALLQWEDFKKGTAFALHERYRKVLPSFNDDIQGTAAVTVAGIMAACRVTGRACERNRIVILGAGAAGIGIARLLRQALAERGLSGDELAAAFAVLDSRGLVATDTAIQDEYKRPFAWPAELAARHGLGAGKPRDLKTVVRALKPTVLIGTSGQPGAFDEPLVREMASYCERPMILPLSNPTSKSEATPENLLRWTEGRALVATGSPFPPVSLGDRSVRIGQGNNAFIFPGVGLGTMVAGAWEVTERMFAAAAQQLAEEVSERDLAEGSLYPPVSALRRVTARVAEAVVRAARDGGVAPEIDDSEIPERIAAAMWDPEYLPYEPV